MKISSNFVTFLENMNFNSGSICLYLKHRRYKCLGKLRFGGLSQTPFNGDQQSTSPWTSKSLRNQWNKRGRLSSFAKLDKQAMGILEIDSERILGSM